MTPADRAALERQAQGLPIHLDDPTVLSQVAAVIADTRSEGSDDGRAA